VVILDPFRIKIIKGGSTIPSKVDFLFRLYDFDGEYLDML